MTHSASFDASDACATRQNSRFFTRTPLRTQCAHVTSSPPHDAESMSLDKSNAGVARGSAAGFWGSDGWRQGWFMCEVCTRASYGAAQGQGGANGAGQMRQQALAAQALKSLERSCRAFLFASPPFICRKDRKEYFSLLTDLPCSVLQGGSAAHGSGRRLRPPARPHCATACTWHRCCSRWMRLWGWW